MKLIRNAGTERVLDLMQEQMRLGHRMDLLTPSTSLFAFEALREAVTRLSAARLVLPGGLSDLTWSGSEADRASRNRLQVPRLARLMAEWLRDKVDVRLAPGGIPQGLVVLRDTLGEPHQAIHGSFGFSTDGLGLTSGNQIGRAHV